MNTAGMSKIESPNFLMSEFPHRHMNTARIQSPKCWLKKKKQAGVLNKNRAMDNVQNHNICNYEAVLKRLINAVRRKRGEF
jgi:hypothetical protein